MDKFFYMNMLWIFYGNISVYETLTFHLYQNMNFIWILYEICITLTAHFMHKKPSSDSVIAKSKAWRKSGKCKNFKVYSFFHEAVKLLGELIMSKLQKVRVH